MYSGENACARGLIVMATHIKALPFAYCIPCQTKTISVGCADTKLAPGNRNHHNHRTTITIPIAEAGVAAADIN